MGLNLGLAARRTNLVIRELERPVLTPSLTSWGQSREGFKVELIVSGVGLPWWSSG